MPRRTPETVTHIEPRWRTDDELDKVVWLRPEQPAPVEPPPAGRFVPEMLRALWWGVFWIGLLVGCQFSLPLIGGWLGGW